MSEHQHTPHVPATPPPITTEKNGVTLSLVHVIGSQLEKNAPYYAINTETGPVGSDGKPSEVLLPLTDYASILGNEFAQRILAQKVKKGLKEVYESAVDQNNGVFDQATYLATLFSYSFVSETMASLKEAKEKLLNDFMADLIGVDSTKPVSETNPPIDMPEFKKRMKVIAGKIERKSRPDPDPADPAAS